MLFAGLATTAAPTTTSSPVLLLITSTAGRFPGWALAIIIPCGIAIILLPFWILLCCLLCGCCAAIKRRWRRRHAYHIQQYDLILHIPSVTPPLKVELGRSAGI
ncbi:hypothetical protein ANANG_G00095360 [Anguilla anguilla]|uniref:Uncharacterized protein n=1 Tax=Anguilla anguilla TaxID=7936 RepID=A0A9D3MHK9_ANGAN|nr:hypothetical protein ANANG_G00095360 [Anguilla anguilla]